MIVAINYANETFARAQTLNTWSLYHKGKADLVIEYGPKDLDPKFCEENREILKEKRGSGYWLWKPYLILKTLKENVPEGGYLFYCDSGAVMLQPIQLLIDAMEQAQETVMCFSIGTIEKHWTKRDAFILMDCDEPQYTETPQRAATYVLIKKCEHSQRLVEDWLNYAKDPRILTNLPNEMGLPNYDGFRENRHDQTVWSLLTKKHGIPAFCDPSQFGQDRSMFPNDVQQRSTYPVVVNSHRQAYLKTWTQYKLYAWAIQWKLGRRLIYYINKICRKEPFFSSFRNRNKRRGNL